MSSRELGPVRSRCLRVLPRPRGSWIVATGRGNVLSEHATATEAEIAAMACLREGEDCSSLIATTAAIDALDQRRPGHRGARASPAPADPRRDRYTSDSALASGP
jgi:hypothetical protein